MTTLPTIQKVDVVMEREAHRFVRSAKTLHNLSFLLPDQVLNTVLGPDMAGQRN